MDRRHQRLLSVAALIAPATLALSQAQAQFAGACCKPDQSCVLVSSPWECSRLGGVFLGPSTTCCDHPCADHYIPGYGMSQTAARRLTRQGVVHTLWVYNPLEVIDADHPMWLLHGQYGQIIAPHIGIDVRAFPHADPEVSAQNAADATLIAAGEALTAWNDAWTRRELTPAAPFAWALRLEALGQPFTWYLSEANGRVPTFSNHENDVIDDRLSSRQYISGQHGTKVGAVINSRRFQIPEDLVDGWFDAWEYFGQFEEEFYLTPRAAQITVAGQTVDIAAYDKEFRTFLLDESFTGTLVEDMTFSISRSDYEYGLRPCYFFKNGSAELSTWVETYCDRLKTATWPVGLPPPVAVIVPTEDVGEVTIDFANYLLYLQDDKAKGDVNGSGEDDGFTIDGVHNLEDWHNLYARDRSGNLLTTVDPEPLEWESPGPGGPDYAPYNEDYHSYIAATFTTAYNYHREQSTWVHFRDLWPRAILTQYIHGKGYGVTYERGVDVREVPGGPGESGYHGVPGQWKESVNWDAYYCITSPYHSAQLGPDGGQRPVIYESAQTTLATAAGGGGSNEVPLLSSLPFDPDWYLPGIPLFIEFLEDGPNEGITYEVDGWDSGSQTLQLTSNLASTSINGHQFRIYYPFQWYFDFRVYGVKWPMIETYCARYGEEVDAAGFLAASKKWAAEQARAQTYALPENPYTLTVGPGQVPGWYNGIDEPVSRVSVYPHEPFDSQDGWLTGTDWAEVASQARDYGVNHFDWFVPNLVVNTAAPNDPAVWEPSAVMDEVMMAIYMMTGIGDPYVHHNIACIADWNGDGVIEAEDAVAFGNALVGEDPTTDLNNDGAYNAADLAIYEAAFCVGDCAPIDDPGCTGTGNCADADWCDDTMVGIDDIFCFLSDWFAMDYDARNYGGTEGVAAIYAFLGNWFAWGIGPCSP